MMPNIVGIDPGLTGAVALVSNSGFREVRDTPTQKIGKRNRYLVSQMVEILRYFDRIGPIDAVIIEHAGSMPKQGVASTFSFGYGFGLWVGICAAHRYRMELVRPQAWKKRMLAGMVKEKGASIVKVEQIYPEAELVPDGCRKPSHGRADAVCIAEYGRLEGMVLAPPNPDLPMYKPTSLYGRG